MSNTDAENLVAEYRTAKAQGHGTTADRVAKQLAAIGYGTNGKPLASREESAPAAATERKAAAGPEPAARGDAPKGRTSPGSRQSRT